MTSVSQDVKSYLENEDVWNEDKSGPLAILWNHRELIYALTKRDVRARYKQSVLGIAWALLQPLSLMLIYTLVFSHIVKVNTGGIPYPIFSYIALLPWTFFAGGLISGTECMVSNFNLITKIYFPREVFPISAVLGRTVDFAIGILVIIPLFFFYHIRVTWALSLVLPILLFQTIFLLGITFILSSINLFYRDIRHVMPLLTQLWMYLCPIIYSIESVPERYFSIYMLNPMASFLDSYRKIALTGDIPDWEHLIIAAVISVITLIVGYLIFKKLEPAFAEVI